MPDREKVIKGLECHLKELCIGKTCYECPYIGDNPCEIQLIANALQLLKEYDATLRLMDEAPIIAIRCIDCKYYDSVTGICANGITHGYAETWWCKDGERR